MMAAAITAGSKFAHNSPGPAGKLAIGVASVAISAGAIIAKNIAGEVNQVKKAEYIDSDKSSFMSLPTESSGNSAIDLLNILQYFHSLEIFFVLCMGFYFIIMKLD
jgi:NADH dehydrogenase FAD-containing subunit